MNLTLKKQLFCRFFFATFLMHSTPIEVIMKLLKNVTTLNGKSLDFPNPCDNSSTIFDFFASSGTTGHAVLKLNDEDGGHRKFILCTNNENGICRKITYERISTKILHIFISLHRIFNVFYFNACFLKHI